MIKNPFYLLLDFPEARDDLRKLALDFAKNALRDFPELAASYPMPPKIWKQAGKSRLLSLGIEERYGGLGGDYQDIAVAAADICFASASPGLALSIFLHQLIANFIMGKVADQRQKELYLKRLASGEISFALAVSEAEAGANPKKLKARAERVENGWQLYGSKSFISNAGLADFFIVIVITGEKDNKKEFTAFILPKDSEGLKIRDIGPLPFFRPSPHGEISFQGLFIEDSHMLGKEGQAFDLISRPFRKLEDRLMSGALAGGLAALLFHLCQDIEDGDKLEKESLTAIGLAKARIGSFVELAKLSFKNTREDEKASILHSGIRDLASICIRDIKEAFKDINLSKNTEILLNDMEKSEIIGKFANQIKLQRNAEKLIDSLKP